jgi:hypothetical protein
MMRFICQHCGVAVTQDVHGSGNDATDGDGCAGSPETGESENEVHEGTGRPARVHWTDPDQELASGWARHQRPRPGH